MLFSVEERKRIARAFAAAAGDRLDVAVHCGAQTTADTVALAADAASLGVAAVAVISPPYFPLDEASQLAHLVAAAAACAPTPFYVYEFEARSGYAVAPAVVERLREIAPNLAGMKVSDSPLDRVTPYLFDGLDIFVGAEPLIFEAAALGAVGSVSGLSSAFPDVVAPIVHEPTAEGAAVLDRLRKAVSAFPFQPRAEGRRGGARRGDPRGRAGAAPDADGGRKGPVLRLPWPSFSPPRRSREMPSDGLGTFVPWPTIRRESTCWSSISTFASPTSGARPARSPTGTSTWSRLFSARPTARATATR